ncbi:MAG TPA: hypothetical protein PKY77_20340 [Phycisphaerae bacterium]|nr:hypothetical protein [Phycisphaerae bacterium]HRY71029.1 hypothetical protein [Phycisphaerae bacterium]HSA29359.1 hypothetical protein [Phycisphaerae bacterium]
MSASSTLPSTNRLLMWGLALFLLAVIARVGWVVVRFGSPERSETLTYPDEEAYWEGARSLAAEQGLVDEFGFRATYMPAYPAFLSIYAGCQRPLFWARVGQALFGALAAPAAMFLAWRWCVAVSLSSGIRIIAPLAGTLVALDPFLVFFSGLLLTEALFAVVLVGCMAFAVSMADRARRLSIWDALLGGVMAWGCIMLRPSAVFLVLLLPVVIVLRRRFGWRSFAAGGLLFAVPVLGLVPWAVRNHQTVGHWRWLTTRGGISLYDGVRAGATGDSDLAHTKIMAEVQGLSEVAWDAYFRAQAWEAIAEDPGRIVCLMGVKFLRTWSLTPNVAAYRGGMVAWISGIWMLAVLILAMAGFCVVVGRKYGREGDSPSRRERVATAFLLLLPVIVFTLLHMVFVGSVRYRVPIMPFICVLAATGLVALGPRRRTGNLPR